MPSNNSLKNNYVSAPFCLIFNSIAILTQKQYEEERQLRRKILEEFVVPTVEGVDLTSPYQQTLTKSEIANQLQKAKTKNTLLMKNIEKLKAKSEKGIKKLTGRGSRTTVQDLTMHSMLKTDKVA